MSAQTAGGALLSAAGICVDYEGKRAVDGFSLDIQRGGFVGVMGQPGCGKSTAALALLGLARPPGRITAGQVLWQGRNLLEMDEGRLAGIRGSQIGLVTQSPRSALHPMLTVGAQLAKVYRAHTSASRREAREHALEMLRLVGIQEPARRLDAYVHELSTGMAQRVVIAMALCNQPALLVADEPTSGLDVTIQAQVLDRLWEAAGQLGSAVLLVTQDLGIVANYCDRVVVMHRGAVVEEQTVQGFFQAPRHQYSRRVVGLQAPAPTSSPQPELTRNRAAPEVDDVLVRVHGLRKVFRVPGRTEPMAAVDDIDLAIARGECVGLVGESGSGKTTAGRCLLRLEDPDAGEILFAGRALHRMRPVELRAERARMQIVFQDPLDSMNPRWTVEQVIREPLDLATELSTSEKRDRVLELSRATGLPVDALTRRPRELSAGLQQRVAVARAMVTRPDFVVLDEPTSALTPETTAELVDLLGDLRGRYGVAYLLISHDLTTIRDACDRVVVLYLGQVVEEGRTEQIFGAPRHPYTRALIGAHLSASPERRRVDQTDRTGLLGEIVPVPESLVGCRLSPRCPHAVSRCRTEPQSLEAQADGQRVRCWRALEGDID